MQSLEDAPRKKVLLELRKKINQLIAAQEMEDPEAAAEGEMDADEALGDLGSADLEAAEGDEMAALAGEPEEEEDGFRQSMRDYMNPKPRERRPGTGMMIASEPKRAMPAKNKGQFGKPPRRDAV